MLLCIYSSRLAFIFLLNGESAIQLFLSRQHHQLSRVTKIRRTQMIGPAFPRRHTGNIIAFATVYMLGIGFRGRVR
jgi:hypothetical protein